jgi:hypothetical protein
VRAPEGARAAIDWSGSAAPSVDLDRVTTADAVAWCIGRGLKAFSAFRWMARNLGLANNRRVRKASEAAAEEFSRADAAVAAARRAYAVEDWHEFERQFDRYQWAMDRLRIAYMLPLARSGKKLKDAPHKREKDRDREDFLRLGRDILKEKPDLDRRDLLRELRLAPYVREYPERVGVWVRELYPHRGRGRPPKKK